MDESIKGNWIGRRQMATRSRPRITDKTGEKEERRNTLERYSVTEKDAVEIERGKEAWAERTEKIKRRLEVIVKLVEELRGDREEERERWEKEQEEDRERWNKEREEERKRWEKERDEERER